MKIPSASPQQVVHLHVVVQISIFDDEYKVNAINDFVTCAVAGQEAPPDLGVLIKLREVALGIEAGFDVYYLPAGTF